MRKRERIMNNHVKKLASLMFALLIVCLALAACGGQQQNGASAASSEQAASSAATSSAQGASSTTAASALTYTVTRVDGDIDWNSIPQADINNVQWTDDFGITAHAQLCYNHDTLFVHMWAEEQDIRAEYQKDDPTAKCFEDSCLEFFFKPLDDERYMNFEVNPNCAVASEIGTQKTGRVALLPRDDVYNAQSSRTSDGWDLTYELPLEYLRFFYPDLQLQSGTQLRANFYKCGNLTTHKHYLSWSPINTDTPNFHVPENFGTLVFE